ncbi:hypothetical protein L3Q82_024108 [Scortum barcoo]|uniref:Uncharacterized protein n=1 Tax=Scortum barcoo TaxID=214431 RepID=A0ACB8WUU5_9TELE|nr:hypothetical protein L3Q82_024108 [Scortum barcoo]
MEFEEGISETRSREELGKIGKQSSFSGSMEIIECLPPGDERMSISPISTLCPGPNLINASPQTQTHTHTVHVTIVGNTLHTVLHIPYLSVCTSKTTSRTTTVGASGGRGPADTSSTTSLTTILTSLSICSFQSIPFLPSTSLPLSTMGVLEPAQITSMFVQLCATRSLRTRRSGSALCLLPDSDLDSAQTAAAPEEVQAVS